MYNNEEELDLVETSENNQRTEFGVAEKTVRKRKTTKVTPLVTTDHRKTTPMKRKVKVIRQSDRTEDNNKLTRSTAAQQSRRMKTNPVQKVVRKRSPSSSSNSSTQSTSSSSSERSSNGTDNSISSNENSENESETQVEVVSSHKPRSAEKRETTRKKQRMSPERPKKIYSKNHILESPKKKSPSPVKNLHASTNKRSQSVDTRTFIIEKERQDNLKNEDSKRLISESLENKRPTPVRSSFVSAQKMVQSGKVRHLNIEENRIFDVDVSTSDMNGVLLRRPQLKTNVVSNTTDCKPERRVYLEECTNTNYDQPQINIYDLPDVDTAYEDFHVPYRGGETYVRRVESFNYETPHTIRDERVSYENHRSVERNDKDWRYRLMNIVSDTYSNRILVINALVEGGICYGFAAASSNKLCEGFGWPYDLIDDKHVKPIHRLDARKNWLCSYVDPGDLVHFAVMNTDVPVLIGCDFDKLVSSDDGSKRFLNHCCRIKGLEPEQLMTTNGKAVCFQCYPREERQAVYSTKESLPRLLCQYHARTSAYKNDLQLYIPAILSLNANEEKMWLSVFTKRQYRGNNWIPLVYCKLRKRPIVPDVKDFLDSELLMGIARDFRMEWRNGNHLDPANVVRTIQNLCTELQRHQVCNIDEVLVPASQRRTPRHYNSRARRSKTEEPRDRHRDSNW